MSLSIIIVEDETLIAKTMAKRLEKWGHRVLTTPSGIEAIQLIQNNNFDLIICDLMLQDISGFDIIEEVRTKLVNKKAPKIVIMTAYSSSHIHEKAQTYGCKFFSKPFSNLDDVLLEMLR